MRIRRGEASDQAAIESIVQRAYGVYVPRIGLRPGPMEDDYAERIERGVVWIAEEGTTVGLIVLVEQDGALLIENVAVDPDSQGEGIGGALLDFAEDRARAAGLDTVSLYTHEKMSENLAIYVHRGYIETERRAQSGFSRVFLDKRL